MQQNYSKGNYHTKENYSSVTLHWSEFHASSFFLSPEVKKEKYVLSGYLYLRLWVPPSLLKTKALRSLFQATDSAWLMFFSLIRWLENQLHFPYIPLGRVHAWRPCLKPGKSEVGNRNTDAVCFGVLWSCDPSCHQPTPPHRSPPQTQKLRDFLSSQIYILRLTWNIMQPILWPYHWCHIKMRKLIDPAKRWVRWVYVILRQHCHLWIACGSSFQPQKRSFVKQIQLKLPTQTIPVEPPWKKMVPKKKTSPLPLNLRLLWHQQHLPGQGRNGPKLPENLLFKVFSNYPRIVPITQAPARLSLSLECNFRCPPKSWKTYHCHPWCLSFSTFFQELPFVCNHIQ